MQTFIIHQIQKKINDQTFKLKFLAHLCFRTLWQFLFFSKNLTVMPNFIGFLTPNQNSEKCNDPVLRRKNGWMDGKRTKSVS